jgi:hypothetical protein
MLADAIATFGDGGGAPSGEPAAPPQVAGGATADPLPVVLVVGSVAIVGLIGGVLLVVRRRSEGPA